MIDYDKEYHPVIEDYICDYADDDLDEVEVKAFKEALERDSSLKLLSEASRIGRMLIADTLKKAH